MRDLSSETNVEILQSTVRLMQKELERLIAEEEDRLDVKAAMKALKEPGSVSLEKVRAELGL